MMTKIAIGALALAAGSVAWAQDEDREWRRQSGRPDPLARLEQALNRIEAALNRLEAALGGRSAQTKKVEAARGDRGFQTQKVEDRVVRLHSVPFGVDRAKDHAQMWVRGLPGPDQRFEWQLDRKFDFGLSRPAPAPGRMYERREEEDDDRGRCPHCGRSDRR